MPRPVPTRRRGAWFHLPTFLSRPSSAAWLALFLVTALVAIWLRNRDILRDLYDYSSVILSAGRVEQGLRPYTDIKTPMQSATFLLNWGAESVFGHNYLALTWGALVLTIGGTAWLVALLRRRLGWMTALVFAGAIGLAGLAQHTVIFYNPVGILCFAVVVVGAANQPRLWKLNTFEAASVFLALVLGGMNKLNFHAFAVALGAVFVLRAWVVSELETGEAALSIAALFVAGLVLPLGIELAWTGATFTQWYENVLLIPGERYEFARRLLDPAVLMRPPHDFHHHVPFKPMGLVGVAVVVVTAALAMFRRWRGENSRPPPPGELLLLGVSTLGACAGGVLLTLTNVESILLTTLGFLVAAVALWIAFAPAGVAPRFLSGAACLWIALGGYATWHGSRVLYGPEAPNRADYVRLNDEAPLFRYLHGVRLDPGLHQSLQRVATELRGTSRSSTEVFFGPAMEWLERSFPQSVIRGMPVWYHSGTALNPEDGPWLVATLEKRGVQRLVMNHNWESWPPVFEAYVHTRFTAQRLGPAATLYTRLDDAAIAARTALKVRPVVDHPSPAHFRGATSSNVFLRGTRFDRDMTLYASPWGNFFGRDGTSHWDWQFGVHRLKGTMAATLDFKATESVLARCRIVAVNEGRKDVMWERTVELDPQHPNVTANFELSPGGRRLEFEVELPESATGLCAAGWRDLRISHSGSIESAPPFPYLTGLMRQDAIDVLVGDLCFGPEPKPEANAVPQSIAERWLMRESDRSNFSVAVGLEKDPRVAKPEAVVLALAWYKAGRIEILSERTVDPSQEASVKLDGWMPEPQGWVGVITRPADPQSMSGGVHLGEVQIH